jgi:hypothetical protein
MMIQDAGPVPQRGRLAHRRARDGEPGLFARVGNHPMKVIRRGAVPVRIGAMSDGGT